MRTDLNRGLSKKEVRLRLQKEGKNTVYRSSYRASVTKLLKQVVFEPCALLLMLCAVLAGFFGQNIAQDAIVALIIINWVCVFLAYVTARMIMANSTESTIPTATVCRDGKLYKIKQNNICHGDVIILEKGDVVPADARLIYANNLTLLEASLTGDLTIKHKTTATIPGDNLTPKMQNNMVFATTIVAGGSGRAIVCETGEDTLAVILRRNIELTSNDTLSSIGSLRRYCSLRSIAILSVVFVLSLVDLVLGFAGNGVFGVFISGLCLACAAMCEYSTIFGYIIVGSGLFNALKNSKEDKSGAIVKNTSTIENLSDITTLILPKNGAFTSEVVHIDSLFCDLVTISPDEKKLGLSCKNLISCALDTTAYGENGYFCVGNVAKSQKITGEDKAIFAFAEKCGVFNDAYKTNHILTEHIETAGLSPKCFSLIKLPTSCKFVARGDLSYILSKCTYIRGVEKTKITHTDTYKIKEACQKALDDGCTVLCIASKETKKSSIEEAMTEKDWVFEGFITINESGLGGANKNVKRLTEAGINVIMLSDDTSLANRMYARSVGIIEDENSEVSTAQSVRSVKSQFLRGDGKPYKLYEGLNSSQISMLIDALHDNGEVVGYFGGDFNDIALLKQADVGFSSGVAIRAGKSSVDAASVSNRQCNEALKLICDVIVSPIEKRGGGFNAIVKSIAQARVVLLNILSGIRYLTTTQYARIVLVFLSMILSGTVFGINSLIQPVQVLFTGLICDFAMIINIAFVSPDDTIPKREDIDGDYSKPLSKNIRSVVIGIIWAVLTVGVLVLIRSFGIEMSANQMGTVSFYGFIITQLVVGLESLDVAPVLKKKPQKNFPYTMLVVIMLAFILLTQLIPQAGILFGIEKITLQMLLMTLPIPLVMFIIYELFKRFSVFESKKTGMPKDRVRRKTAILPDIEEPAMPEQTKIRNNKSNTVDTDWIEDVLKLADEENEEVTTKEEDNVPEHKEEPIKEEKEGDAIEED